jgi:CSLREA domain-containing protein
MAVGLEGTLGRRRGRWLALSVALLACIFAFGSPAAASAASYEVDSVADEQDEDPGNGVCKTAGNVCTLRAAVEESNDSAASDQIEFVAAFDG